jgi:8-oxo-dGTP diphosphatase
MQGEIDRKMAKSSKLVAVKRGRILLVRRRRDQLWMFPGGQKRERESEKDCLRREIKEELPKLKLGRIRLWKKVNGTNRHSGRRMSDAIFIVNKVSGDLTIGDKHEIDKATWRKPRGTRLTQRRATSGTCSSPSGSTAARHRTGLYYCFVLRL